MRISTAASVRGWGGRRPWGRHVLHLSLQSPACVLTHSLLSKPSRHLTSLIYVFFLVPAL